jgi:AcrR family transcriptional regulator
MAKSNKTGAGPQQGPRTGSGRGRRSNGNPRQDLIEAAIYCYGEKGLGETSLADIAKRAGLEPSHLKYYFPTFVSLFAAVVEYIRTDLIQVATEALMKAGDSPIAALEAYSVAIVRWAHAKKTYFRLWMYFYYEATYRPEFIELNRQTRVIGRERISLFIYHAQEKGLVKLPAHYTVPELAYRIQTLLTGQAIMIATEPTPNFEIVEKNLIKELRSVLGTLGPAASR